MLRVTQGHEDSISIEVFIKSFLLLSTKEQEQLIFYVSHQSLIKSLKVLNFNYKISNEQYILIENSKLNLSIIKTQESSTETTTALEEAISDLTGSDILVTMPSTKDQILFESKVCSGHTDYFRKRFDDSSISMVFKNKWEHILLLTDHIPLKSVPEQISKKLIIEKVSVTINQTLSKISNIVFSGINPHAGENGLLGDEDSLITDAIKQLRISFKDITFMGPLAGDSLHTVNMNELLKVYSYHDQGLALFKGLYGFEGVNITLGLPFRRISVDHGTAFDLYGKNCANYMGCFSMLKTYLSIDGEYDNK